MILETYRVYPRSLQLRALNLHIVSVAVVMEVSAERFPALVRDELVLREDTLRHSERTLHELGVEVHLRLRFLPPELVRDFPAFYAGGVSLRAEPVSLLELHPLLRGGVSFQPRGDEVVVVQAVRLRTDAVLLAVFKAEIRRGTAIDLPRVLREARMPLVRLKRIPVERDSRHVEILPKDPAVLRVLLFRLELVEHEDVGAVPEVVRFLSHTDLRARNRLAVSVDDLNRRETLARVLDSGGGALLYYVLVIAERFQHIFFSCHCICSLSPKKLYRATVYTV